MRPDRAGRYIRLLLTKLALLFLTGAAVLTALGCAGGGGASSGDKTFEGDGYSFTYPGAWVEKVGEPANTAGMDVAVGAPESRLSVVTLGVVRDVMPEPVTEANIDQLMRQLRPALDAQVGRVGNVLKGEPTQVTDADLPGLLFEASSTGNDPKINYRDIWLFDGTTQYVINCQFVNSEADDVEQACDLIVKSFHTSK